MYMYICYKEQELQIHKSEAQEISWSDEHWQKYRGSKYYVYYLIYQN